MRDCPILFLIIVVLDLSTNLCNTYYNMENFDLFMRKSISKIFEEIVLNRLRRVTLLK